MGCPHRDTLGQLVTPCAECHREEVDTLRDQAARARRLIADLRTALRPFVLYFEYMRSRAQASSLTFPDPIAEGLVVTDAEIDGARTLLSGEGE